MREMILAGTPGTYIFHYGEESGCIGSSALARNTPETLDGILYAIALDRGGIADVVTSQMGSRCASESFARSIALQLPGSFASAHGVYTDTAEYTDLIPECTNLSVGYYDQHSRDEWIDYAHVGRLLSALLVINPDLLVCGRDPYAVRNTMQRQHDDDIKLFTSARKDHGWDDWCLYCDAPIIDPEDLHLSLNPPDHCTCETTSDLLDDPRVTDEDRKFLAYLRGR